MLRSFANLRRVRPGFEPAGVLTFTVSLPYVDFKAPGASSAFQRELAQKIAAIPGVTAVGGTQGLPLQDFGAGCTAVWREGRPFANDEKPPCVDTPVATPGFFETLGIQVRGRTFTWDDVDPTRKTPTVAVVTRKLADRLWPGEDPIGKGIGIGDAARGFYRVAGVIPVSARTQTSQRVKWSTGRPTSDESYVVRTSLANPSRC